MNKIMPYLLSIVTVLHALPTKRDQSPPQPAPPPVRRGSNEKLPKNILLYKGLLAAAEHCCFKITKPEHRELVNFVSRIADEKTIPSSDSPFIKKILQQKFFQQFLAAVLPPQRFQRFPNLRRILDERRLAPFVSNFTQGTPCEEPSVDEASLLDSFITSCDQPTDATHQNLITLINEQLNGGVRTQTLCALAKEFTTDEDQKAEHLRTLLRLLQQNRTGQENNLYAITLELENELLFFDRTISTYNAYLAMCTAIAQTMSPELVQPHVALVENGLLNARRLLHKTVITLRHMPST